MKKLPLLFFFILTLSLSAQKDSSKTFCTLLADGQSPTKLLFVGYDYVAPHKISTADKYASTSDETVGNKIKFNGGLRIGGNLPIVNKKRWSMNIGYGFRRSTYDINYHFGATGPYSTGLYESLSKRGLNCTSLNTSLFIPLNNRHFILSFVQGEISGDYSFKGFWKRFNTVRGSYSALFGWKKKPNQTIAVGIARTWRGGTAFFNPVLMWNQTFDKHWGIELLLPARGFVRYNFSPRSLFLLGYELEGSSYNLGMTYYGFEPIYKDNYELRRSELRTRITWEKSIYKFLWFSLQAGLRTNYRFSLAFDNNQPRGEYLYKGTMPWTFYSMATINLVVPPTK